MSLMPRDEAELAGLLAANDARVEVLAGGSRRALGGVVSDAVALDVSALRGVVDYVPGEMIVTLRPATPVDELRSLLAEHRQGLAFEPPGLRGVLGGPEPVQSIGGVLAANASGPRRLTAGAARDHFLGFRAVSGRGERFKAGGRVVKNVTGFDLPKLLAGAWGTLAVMTEVTLRVVPLAEHEATLLVPAGSAATAVELMRQALASQHEVSCAAWDAGTARVLLRVEGVGDGVPARVAALCSLLRPPEFDVLEGEQSRGAWERVGAVESLPLLPWLWRVCLPPAGSVALLAAGRADAVLLDWAGGLAWLAFHDCAPGALRELARRHGGHAMLMRAPADAPAGLRRFPERDAGVAALEARVKAAFDPAGRLNPGRLA